VPSRIGGPSTTDPSRRELLGLGALVVLLGIAFVTLVLEQTQAAAVISALR
jgi:hypothetical protein